MRVWPLLTAVALTLAPVVAPAQSDLRAPAAKEWLTIGGDWHNTRYSTLKEINRRMPRTSKPPGWCISIQVSGKNTRWRAPRSSKTA